MLNTGKWILSENGVDVNFVDLKQLNDDIIKVKIVLAHGVKVCPPVLIL